MTRRYHIQGRDSWTARSGYQRSPRIPGPIERPEGDIPAWLGIGLLALVCVVVTLGIVAIGG